MDETDDVVQGLEEKEFNDRTLNGLQSNLYQLQMKTNTLLPDFNLKRGEVKRYGQFPISGTPSMDIWEGMYLNGEKVAIKVVRAVHSDAKSLEVFYPLLFIPFYERRCV